MRLDAHLLFACLCVFSRCGAMVMSAPLLGTVVPVSVRTLFSLAVTFSLVPTVAGFVGAVPSDLVGLTLAVAHEALVGLLIGGFLHLLVQGAQMAGAFLDVQMGTGTAQVFNPFLGVTTTPVAQIKVMLVSVLVFLLNGHHMMLRAFAKSFELAGPKSGPLRDDLVSFMGQTGLLAIQIAAPVAAVTVVIDVAAGVVNKAVPQTQPFLLSLPAKLAAGIVVLALGLPALVSAVQNGLDLTFDHLARALGGG